MNKCFLFSVFLVFLFACSSGPSESVAIEYVTTMGSKTMYKDFFKVRSLRKTNGERDENQYLMSYDIEVECLKQGTSPIGVSCDAPGEIKKGTGKILLANTENGWLPVSDTFMRYSLFESK
jgi:hypothetical protein